MDSPPIRFHGYNYNPEYFFLSNFYVLKEPIIYNNIKFYSTEHLYQYMKFTHCDNDNYVYYRQCIADAKTPYFAKQLGNQRLIKYNSIYIDRCNQLIECSKKHNIICNPDWENVKIEVMGFILLLKFRDPTLRDYLIGTGDREIIEHTQTDPYWGSGFDDKGHNYLGKLLMGLRKTFIDHPESY